jgi:hypothetical protein
MRQYASSPTIQALLNDFQQYFNAQAIFDEFYSIVWDIDSAQGFGLDIWGRIVGGENFNRYVKIPATADFGFQESGNDWSGFGQNPFYTGAGSTNTYALSDSAFRLLILTKAFANISRMNAPTINKLLNILFAGRGRCYCLDLGSMRMQYTFEFPLQIWELTVLTNGLVLPRPAGVKAWLFNLNLPGFGFQEAGPLSEGFGQGTFNSISGIANVN